MYWQGAINYAEAIFCTSPKLEAWSVATEIYSARFLKISVQLPLSVQCNHKSDPRSSALVSSGPVFGLFPHDRQRLELTRNFASIMAF